MKSIFSVVLVLICCSNMFAQQSTFSSFPIEIEKAEYDDREAIFIPTDNKEAGLFLSDNNKMIFILLGSDGEPLLSLNENMPSNFSSLKRAGAGILNDEFVCYLLQGNKKVFLFKANSNNKTFTYTALPFSGSNILFLAAGKGYTYIATTSENSKNEFLLYKYTSLAEPSAVKVTTSEVDFYKSYGISTNKATEQIAVLPMNTTTHFDQTAAGTKCYFDDTQLIITSEEKDGSTKVLTINTSNGENKQNIVKSIEITDKKAITNSLLFKNTLWQLSIAAGQLAINATDLADNSLVYASQKDDKFDTEAYIESSYTFRSGYSLERKSSSRAELSKTFQRANLSGLSIQESNNGNLLLVAGAVSKNNLSDPAIENQEMVQTSSINMVVLMERSFNDLHLPAYSSYQQSLLSFKKEIWVYNMWTLEPSGKSIKRAMPQEIPAIDESLELFFRDPQNNTAPAVWKQGDQFLFGYYSSKSHNYTIYQSLGKKQDFNRR